MTTIGERTRSPDVGMTRKSSLFPGAVGLTHLRVYDSAAPDGLVGGSPHLHLASSEAYVVMAGSGAVHLLSAVGGFRIVPLAPGDVLWFEPGMIHRLINTGGLEILCVMANSGLPEAGDAVLTFPHAVMTDARRYRAAAQIVGKTEDARVAAATRRRDLAVTGFGDLIAAHEGGDDRVLEEFLSAAVSCRRELFSSWGALVGHGPAADVERTRQRLSAIDTGQTDGLLRAAAWSTSTSADHAGVGMCGRLDAFQPEGIAV